MVIPKEESAKRLSVSLAAPRRGPVFDVLFFVFQGRTAASSSCAYVYCCTHVFFFAHRHFFSLAAAALCSCSRLRGTQGARPNTTAQVWALAEVRGTCSGGSKSRKLSSNLSLIHI